MTSVMIAKRYQMQERLGAGGMGVVYRAYDRLTGDFVALKQVHVALERLSFHSKTETASNIHLALAQEFRVLASLWHPNVISVLDYGFDTSRQPYFTMTYLEGHRNLLDYGMDLDFPAQIALLEQMLEALIYLHRRGIVHRDLKPENVLVDAAGQVRVVDFGLAVEGSQQGGLAGTVAYMSPEVLRGKGASPQSDLFSFGIMAVELLTGHYPFGNKNATDQVIMAIINRPADLTGIPDSLVTIIAQLLEKQPSERYQNAQVVQTALARVFDEGSKRESPAIRESFLQAARFVGREAEFALLEQALLASKKGQGSAYLLGGESGVGKSRLVDEVRIHALVKGMLVLKGQAVSEGGSLYHLWQSALQSLVLQVAVTDEEAALLKPIIPDLDRLLDRPIPPAPSISPAMWQERLIQTICSLLERYGDPILLILEDIHWIDDDFPILRTLCHLSQHVPLIIVATYRDDEHPDLAVRLAEMQHLPLSRLSTDDIGLLGRSIIGNLPHKVDIIDYLQTQSEGNVFFLIEVLRALAEQAGTLQRIGQTTLPENLITGGIQAVLEQRLSRVPDYAYQLMQQAALFGRQLDFAVLEQLAPHLDIEQWLGHCTASAIFSRSGEVWEFTHDKIREHILAYLPTEQKTLEAQQVAAAIETAHQHDLSLYAGRLAYLWELADEASLELPYRALAGEQALENNANRLVINHLERAVTLLELMPHLTDAQQQLKIYTILLAAYRNLYGFGYFKIPKIFNLVQSTIEQLQPNENTVRLFGTIWTYFLTKGEYQKTEDVVVNFTRLFHKAPQLAPLYNLALNSCQIALDYHRGDLNAGLQVALATRQQYDESVHRQAVRLIGTSPYTATLNYGAALLIVGGHIQEGLTLADETLKLVEDLNSSFASVFALAFLARHYIILQDYQQALSYIHPLIALSEKYSITYGVLEGRFNQAFVELKLNQHVQRNLDLLPQILDERLQAELILGLSQWYLFLAEIQLQDNQPQIAYDYLLKAFDAIENLPERLFYAEAFRVRGDFHLAQHNLVTAEADYRQAIATAQAQGAKLWELRASTQLAKLLKLQGKRMEAMSLLTPLLNSLHQECHFIYDYKQARQVLMS